MQYDKWKHLALYLLSCHAATMEHECSLKSYPQCFKSRCLAIGEKGLAILNGTADIPERYLTEEWSKDRLEKALANLKEAIPYV